MWRLSERESSESWNRDNTENTVAARRLDTQETISHPTCEPQSTQGESRTIIPRLLGGEGLHAQGPNHLCSLREVVLAEHNL
jgi:hypothetical protein